MLALGSLLRGRCEADVGNHGAAESQLLYALKVMRRTRNVRGESLALLAFGLVTAYHRSPEEALPYYRKGLDLALEHDIISVQVAIYNNLSSCYVALGQLDDAVVAAETSLAIRDRHGFTHGRGSTLNNLAAAQCLRGDLAQAAHRVEDSLTVSEATCDHQSAREAWMIKSEVALRQGQLVEAERCIGQALTFIRTMGDRYCEALALHQHAKVLTAVGRFPDAQEASREAATARTRTRARTDVVLEKVLCMGMTDSFGELLEVGPRRLRVEKAL
jgi:tetratricopeptide (TPR) repeat protein